MSQAHPKCDAYAHAADYTYPYRNCDTNSHCYSDNNTDGDSDGYAAAAGDAASTSQPVKATR